MNDGVVISAKTPRLDALPADLEALRRRYSDEALRSTPRFIRGGGVVKSKGCQFQRAFLLAFMRE